jgi:class 3 adenylate cyclase/predicted ATPase
MKFSEIVEQALILLHRQGRVSYRALKREFDLADDVLEDLKVELIDARQVVRDENGKVLVWIGNNSLESRVRSLESERRGRASTTQTLDPRRQTLDTAAERRQLTVMFCDLVDSTTLSEQLDPEEWREVVQAYQATCAEIISRFDGYIAQYLGDGILVYFGYPVAHEDDAGRAVHVGLGIIETLQQSPIFAAQSPLRVRIGVHTGLVVVGEIGGGNKREQLALGDTPNIAARLQGLAEPNAVVMSAATHRLVQGLFECQAWGPQTLKGFSTPLAVYQVMKESEVQSRFEVAVRAGLTPLAGREEEMGLLLSCWEHVKAGEGQVIFLNGEAGIGKSRLLQELKEQVGRDDCTKIEFRCSPHYHNTALYPVIEHIQRFLQFHRADTPQEKLGKLERVLKEYHLPLQEVTPLFAALLSLPHPDQYPPINLTPQKQRQKTQEALVAWLLEEGEKKATLAAWEDLHWADPSTLELLRLFLAQAPTSRLLTLLTFRPEFSPPWGMRPHFAQLTLNRLERRQVEGMITGVMGGESLPPEVVEQIVNKTDGVPLFVEELTKMMLESGLLRKRGNSYELSDPLPPLAIPATLQDSLMARLDRLSTVREVAQLGATLGREFTYELLEAVWPGEQATLQRGLMQLVEAELVYQRGLPPQTKYIFKHALIQETAYHSVLKSRRQQYHAQIAQVLEERFPETQETQPELLAHHYTEAGLDVQAIPYWQSAGQRASRRSAHVEAIGHLTKALELLNTVSDAPERNKQELALQIALGASLLATKGFAAPEAGAAYTQARELCQQVGDPAQLFFVLMGLRIFYLVRGEIHTAQAIGEQFLQLAQNAADPAFLLEAHYALGVPLTLLGEFGSARIHLEQSAALYDPQRHHSHAFLYGLDPGVTSLTFAPLSLWALGYPEQSLAMSHKGLTLAQQLAHPHSLAFALTFAAFLHQHRREEKIVQELVETAIALSREQGFALWSAVGLIFRGWALVEQGQSEEGIAQIREGLTAWRATGAEGYRTRYLAMLAEAYGKVDKSEEGLTALAEAFAMVEKTGERWHEAELYQLKGKLLLTQEGKSQTSKGKSEKSKVPKPKSQSPDPQSEAEACFLKAIDIAQRQ